MLEQLLACDRALFLAINSLHTPLSDALMTFVSGKLTWLPFYLFLMALAWYYKGSKGLLWLLVGTGLCVLLADRLSVMAFKNVFQRLRPCHDPLLQGQVWLPDGHCGGLYGFISSHAANVFAVATFIALYLRHRWLTWTLLLWAALVSCSRIFMGAHFPGDILGGALVGALIGWCVWRLLRYLLWHLPRMAPAAPRRT